LFQFFFRFHNFVTIFPKDSGREFYGINVFLFKRIMKKRLPEGVIRGIPPPDGKSAAGCEGPENCPVGSERPEIEPVAQFQRRTGWQALDSFH